MYMVKESHVQMYDNSLALCHFKVLKRLLVKLKITIKSIFELSQLHQVQLGQVHSLKVYDKFGSKGQPISHYNHVEGKIPACPVAG